MSDTPNDPQATESGEQAAVAEPEQREMSLSVDIENVGPCKKHVKVTVPRDDIDWFYSQAVEKFQGEAAVPGFRPGHVPAKLIEKRFRKELADQVKQDLLMESLEQVSEQNDLDPINEPEMDVAGIEIPEEGDFVYEFDVEVRPEFSLPDYDGLELERPVREISDEEVDSSLNRYLMQYASLSDSEEPIAAGDFVALSLTAEHDGETLREIEEFYVSVKPVLRFVDAELEGFDELLVGKQAGETVETEATISAESENVEMRGEAVKLSLELQSVKKVVLPEVDKDFLERVGLDTEDDLREAIRESLERQVTYEQRQSTRRQVLEKITESADWDLPENLVLKQVDNAMRREILEMQQAGFTTAQIRARENEMKQKAVSETRQALKEHFVLDKIATEQDIEVTPSDIESEIYYMAMQRGESPRRVRARLVKSGMIENLEAQIRERKAVDVVLERAKFKDVELPRKDDSDRIEAVRFALCQQITESAAEEDEDLEEEGGEE